MDYKTFFQRLLKAIVVWFNRNVYGLCKLITRIIKAIKIRSERLYTDRKNWENY